MVHFIWNWSKIGWFSMGLYGNNLKFVLAAAVHILWHGFRSHFTTIYASTIICLANMKKHVCGTVMKHYARQSRGEGANIFINFEEKPQCCSHLQLLWNYVVGMLTNWASWIDRVFADLSQEFHRFSQHLKRNSKEFVFLFVRWHPLTDRFTTLGVGCHEINNVKIILLS